MIIAFFVVAKKMPKRDYSGSALTNSNNESASGSGRLQAVWQSTKAGVVFAAPILWAKGRDVWRWAFDPTYYDTPKTTIEPPPTTEVSVSDTNTMLTASSTSVAGNNSLPEQDTGSDIQDLLDLISKNMTSDRDQRNQSSELSLDFTTPVELMSDDPLDETVTESKVFTKERSTRLDGIQFND